MLFTDLDGTLIFSAKRKQDGDLIIEYKDGEPISCITARQAELFPKLRYVFPVTTRSIEQYKRIEFAKFGFKPVYALCDNGGTLLINGEPDIEWLLWSGAVYAECEREMKAFRELLERDPDRSFEIRLVDGLFLFTKSNSPEKTLKYIRENGKGELCECFHTGAKVYVTPKKLNKGAAVKRLAKRIGLSEFAAAGDSLMDLSMLNAANFAIYPDDLPEISVSDRLSFERERFPEFVTEWAANSLR